MVYPSGRFFEPSLLNPEGSNFAGKPAKATALLIMSLALKCLGKFCKSLVLPSYFDTGCTSAVV